MTLASIVADKAARPSSPAVRQPGAPFDVVLHLVTLMCGVDAAGLPSAPHGTHRKYSSRSKSLSSIIAAAVFSDNSSQISNCEG